MAIIQFPNTKDAEITDINSLILDSIEHTALLEELMRDAPDILDGHCNLRDILRSVKRGNTLKDSIDLYALECCPPRTFASEECSETTCSDCWYSFIQHYQETVGKTKRGEYDDNEE